MSQTRIYIGPDHDLTYEGAKVAGAYLNLATVTYTLKTLEGATLANGTLARDTSLDIPNDPDYEAGNYSAVIDGPTVTAGLTPFREYAITITLAQGTDDDRRRIDCVAWYRE